MDKVKKVKGYNSKNYVICIKKKYDPTKKNKLKGKSSDLDKRITTFAQNELNKNGEITVVQFKRNKYLASDDIQQMGDELFQVVTDGATQVVLDMSAIEFLSSAALNRLIMLNKKFKDVGGALRLSGLTSEIDKIFTITRLNTLFTIHPDVPSALTSF